MTRVRPARCWVLAVLALACSRRSHTGPVEPAQASETVASSPVSEAGASEAGAQGAGQIAAPGGGETAAPDKGETAGPGTQIAAPGIGERANAQRSGPYRVATFNAGLAPGVVRDASERAPLVSEAIASSDLDLICVQEVWLDQHWQELVTAARPRLPTALRLEPTLADAGPTCTRAELAPLRACATSSCANLASDRLAACVIQRCSAIADRISVACVNCVARNPSGTLQSITEACVRPDTAETPGAAGRAGGMIAYGGSYGLGLLTRYTVLEQDVLRFHSALNPRAVLYAKVNAGARGLHVFCTHLTPVIAGLAHPLGGSWRRDHATEISALTAFIAQRTKAGEPTMLLGDLNTGPAVSPAIDARLPEDYGRLLAEGFSNPYVNSGHAACTFCDANPLVSGIGRRGALIDHILVRDVAERVEVEPFMRSPVTLGVGSRARRSAYSDHYGLAAIVGNPAH
jgi:endonuclease/exonuclease/phosphatase family metal-dependent hydrolase